MHNYSDYGIVFVMEEVRERISKNGSDTRVIGECPIAVVKDVQKFRDHFGDNCILGIMDGTSVRVMAQDIGRRGLKAGMSRADMETAVYNRLRGVRNARSTQVEVRVVEKIVEKVIRTLPNGESWTGDDIMEYRQLYTLQLTESGVPAAVAASIASNLI